MQGILKSFKPKLVNDKHYFYEKLSLYYFIVTITVDNQDIIGEAFSKSPTGSNNWQTGKMHEFEKKDNNYAEGGSQFKGLKVIESVPNNSSKGASPSFDIVKESFVISRYAHTFALERLLSLTEADRKKLEEDYGHGVISKLATSISKSVYERAAEVQHMHEAGNSKAS